MNIVEIIKELVGYADVIIFLAGLILLGVWLLKTSLGRAALVDSLPRRNNMPVYLPFIPLLIWFTAVAAAVSIKDKLLPYLADWQNALADNIIFCAGGLITVVVTIFLARASFTLRLRGFGLDVKNIGKDFLAAVLNLLSVWPIMTAVFLLTLYVGEAIFGPDFEIGRNQELELIMAYPQLSVRILIVVVAVVVAPVLEELIFRGMLQTMIRSFLETRNLRFEIRNGAWLSILISSGLFAMVHSDAGHWPALFVLSVCLGYSYEKSGSLFRPIFIHLTFNAVMITAALYSV